jgi:hypothetical protein
MVKPGDKIKCGVCGLEVVCVEGCGCHVDEIICCSKPMKKAAAKKAAKRTAAKKAKKKR